MDESLFGRLLAELRARIYEHALTFGRVSCRPREPDRFWPERSLVNKLALTRVCKQLRGMPASTLHLEPSRRRAGAVTTILWRDLRATQSRRRSRTEYREHSIGSFVRIQLVERRSESSCQAHVQVWLW
jgi:hypothetical protein